MDKRTTITDIAKRAGVSIGTVHCALNGKPGVSDATRSRIMELAKQMDYRPNTVAASLKRKTLRIAAAFPGPTEESRYYYSFIWQGLRESILDRSDFNVRLIEVPFYAGPNNQGRELLSLLETETIDGLITTGYTDLRGMTAVQGFIQKGIPVVLVGDDNLKSGRMLCVRPDYQVIGRTIAELLTRQIPDDGGILVLAGDVIVPSHYMITQGFDAYLNENGYKNPVYRVHETGEQRMVYQRLLREIGERNDLSACWSVNARNSVLLGRALKESGCAGTIAAVGSDLFLENVQYLKDGVFTNLL
ncbi:MAG: LacI family transcriptional regulator, partial [Clostridia bacterium]|nr:LacI family transcriptional regulator [Clostridia bacterium]